MEELELDTTNFENAEPVAGLPGTRWDKKSVRGVDRQSQPPAADPSRTPNFKESGASRGGSDSTAGVSEGHMSVVLDEQVRFASQ